MITASIDGGARGNPGPAGYGVYIERVLNTRGGDGARAVRTGRLAPAIALLSRLVEQHHIVALMRRAASAALVTAVSEVKLDVLPNGQNVAREDPHDLLSVEHLAERLPRNAQPKAEQSWEWRRPVTEEGKQGVVLTLVEAVHL